MYKLKHFRILGTDVILQDYEDGKGKIILSNDDRDYNLSYYWGSMGEGYNLSKFILKTNDEYLINKLGMRESDGDIDIKKTMSAVRRCIKEDTSWRFYMNLEADKLLREALNNVQFYSGCQNEFVDMMMELDVDFPINGNQQHSIKIESIRRGAHFTHVYEHEFKSMLETIKCEPWYFIVNKEPEVNTWLKQFLPKLREHLKKEREVNNG